MHVRRPILSDPFPSMSRTDWEICPPLTPPPPCPRGKPSFATVVGKRLRVNWKVLPLSPLWQSERGREGRLLSSIHSAKLERGGTSFQFTFNLSPTIVFAHLMVLLVSAPSSRGPGVLLFLIPFLTGKLCAYQSNLELLGMLRACRVQL